MTFVPNSADQSPGYQIHLLIMQFYKTVETTLGTNPPGCARWYFLMGCLYWNSYAVMYPSFPFVDGFDAPRIQMNPQATESECFDFFLQLLAVCYQYLAETELPSLPPIVVPSTARTYAYVQSQFAPAVKAYLDGRRKDGYYTTEPFPFPNKGSYIQVHNGSTQNLNQVLPSPGTWAPLDTHYPDGTHKAQKPLQPYFVKIKNWLSDDQMTAMYEIAEANYPSESLYKTQEQAMVDLQPNLTEDQKLKAEIWAGTTYGLASPPSKLMIFLALVLASNSLPLKESVALLGGMTFSLFHAGICAWGVKYKYLQPRPIQGIRRDYLGKPVVDPITNKVVDGGDWIPYQKSNIYTPPFPDYVSGHSTFSMAVAVFFQMILHSDTIPIGAMVDMSYFQAIADNFDPNKQPTMLSNLCLQPHCSVLDPNLPTGMIELKWNTWTELAREIGYSRITGGIHWSNSNLGGFAIGEWVAIQMIHQLDWNALDLDFSSISK